MKTLGAFIILSLSAVPSYGQTLSDFQQYVIIPLATQSAHEQAETKRTALLNFYTQHVLGKDHDKTIANVIGKLAHPSLQLGDLAGALDRRLSHNDTRLFYELLRERLADQATARKEIYAADLLLKTVREEDGTFSVCEQKLARRWKAEHGGFTRLQDQPC